MPSAFAVFVINERYADLPFGSIERSRFRNDASVTGRTSGGEGSARRKASGAAFDAALGWETRQKAASSTPVRGRRFMKCPSMPLPTPTYVQGTGLKFGRKLMIVWQLAKRYTFVLAPPDTSDRPPPIKGLSARPLAEPG
jgi:hypothetical protein